MTDRFDDPGTALSPQGSARPSLRFAPDTTLSTGTQSDGTHHLPWPPEHHRSHPASTDRYQLEYATPTHQPTPCPLPSPEARRDRGGMVRTCALVLAMAWFAVGVVVALIAPDLSVVIVVAVVVLLIPLTFAAAASPATTMTEPLPHNAYPTAPPISSRRRRVRALPGERGALVGGSANSPLPPSLQHTSHNPGPSPRLG